MSNRIEEIFQRMLHEGHRRSRLRAAFKAVEPRPDEWEGSIRNRIRIWMMGNPERPRRVTSRATA